MAIRAEERTPYTTVVFQECERMNVLMAEIKYSLIKLHLGLKVTYLLLENPILEGKTENLSNFRESSQLHQTWRK